MDKKVVIAIVVAVVVILLAGVGYYLWRRHKREYYCYTTNVTTMAKSTPMEAIPKMSPMRRDTSQQSGDAYSRIAEEDDYYPPLAVLNEMREVQSMNGTMNLDGPFVMPLSPQPWYSSSDPRGQMTPQQAKMAAVEAIVEGPKANGTYVTLPNSWSAYPSSYPQSQPELSEQCTVDNVTFCQMSDGRPGTCNMGLCNPSFMATR